MKTDALQSIMPAKPFKLFVLIGFLFLIFCISYSCQQSNKEIKIPAEAIALNNAAGKISFDVVGGKLPKDSLVQSIALYKKAIEIEKNYKLAYYNLLDNYKSLNLYDEMIALTSSWLNIHPEDTDMHYHRAMVYELLGKNQQADADYSIVVKSLDKDAKPQIDSKLTSAQIQELINSAYVIYIAKKDQPEALAILKQLKIDFPNDGFIDHAYQELLKNERLKKIQSLLNYFPIAGQSNKVATIQ